MRGSSVVIGAVFFACAGILIILLGLQNDDLKNSVARLKEEAGRPRVGHQLPEVHMETLQNGTVTIAASGGKPQLLFYFLPDCPYTVESMAHVREVAASAKRLQLDFIGVVPDAPNHVIQDFLREHDLSFPVIEMGDERLRRQFDFRISPTFYVVGPSGQTVAQHIGRLATNTEVSNLATAAALMDESWAAHLEKTQ